MPKAYWIAHVRVDDPDTYKLYATAATEIFPRYGARVLARGGRYETLEGADRPRNVVIEFPSLETAKACWASPEYQAARAHRLPVSDIHLTIVEAVE
jgi:uncharacterized protein (DUF1330 family)